MQELADVEMAQGGLRSNDSNRPGDLGNRGTSTFISGLPEYSLRPGDSFQNVIDWSFDDTLESCSEVYDMPSSESSLSPEFASESSNSHTEKKVQFASDSDKLPRYRLHKNSMCKVSFPGKTWDIMMQGFRIALEVDNVFICNNFMGAEGATALLQELWFLRNTGEFDKQMRKGPLYNYSCLYILKQNKIHRQIDALVLMVYKLALYYTDQWNKISVELCYYPEGHSSRIFSTEKYESERKILKCIYFPNTDWTPEKEKEEISGLVSFKTSHRLTRVEPVMDRLIVFWGDCLEHSINASSKEKFGMNLYIKR